MRPRSWLIAIIPALVLGCGGSGSGDATGPAGPGGAGLTPPTDDGIDGSGVTTGPIRGFGSILVADVRFDVSGAVIRIDGDPATEADLRLGMFVTVEGDVDPSSGPGGRTGVAHEVSATDELEGPVESVDPAASRFVALGRTVVVDAETVFEGTSLAELEPDEDVVVSGFPRSDGSVLATRVELVEELDEVELTGRIRDLDEVDEIFELFGLTIDFEEAVLRTEDPDGDPVPAVPLAEGQLVEVFGPEPEDGLLLAEEVVVLLEDELEEGEEWIGEGVITDVQAPDLVVLNDEDVVGITDETEFEDGDREDLEVDAVVLVFGFVKAGVVEADLVVFEDED